MAKIARNKDDVVLDFESIFECASIGILVTNRNGTIIAANPFALKEFGYNKNELQGLKIETLIPSRYHSSHIELREHYTAEMQCRSIGAGKNMNALKKDGTEFPAEICLGSYNSRKVQYVIAFIKDITERIQDASEIMQLKNELETTVEQRTQELQATLRQLEMSKERLRKAISFQKAIFDNAGVMISATDANGILKFFNPEACHTLGYHASEVINKFTPVLFHDKNELKRKRISLGKKFGLTFTNDFDVMVEKAKRNIYEEEQYTYIRKNGTTFPVSLTITGIRDRHGEITGYMGVAVDISRRIKAENELREGLKKEKELSELKSRFVSMASHEFRTPLSTVLSSAYLIEKYTGTDEQPKREKHLQRILSSVNMLTDILNDFLSVGKLEEGKIQVRLSNFNIREMILQVTDEIKNTLKKGQEIHCQHEGETAVMMDISLLKHIIMNMVSNASKFSQEKSIINIKTSCRKNRITLSVKDHGIGISKDDQRHLMERFFRGANAGNIQGTGLGLHIVSKYAELMNGRVTCKSELEKGTEFIITFNSKQQ
jgi:PAS domain S-box-containing protein